MKCTVLYIYVTSIHVHSQFVTEIAMIIYCYNITTATTQQLHNAPPRRREKSRLKCSNLFAAICPAHIIPSFDRAEQIVYNAIHRGGGGGAGKKISIESSRLDTRRGSRTFDLSAV